MTEDTPPQIEPSLKKAAAFVALIGTWPLTNFAISNATWLGGARGGYLTVVLVAVAVAALAVGALWLATFVSGRFLGRRNIVRLAFFLASALLILFSFDTLSRAFSSLNTVSPVQFNVALAYGATFILVPLVLLWIVTRKVFLDFGLVFAAVAAAASLLQLVFLAFADRPATAAPTPAAPSLAAEQAAPPAGRKLPNIYHVLADQYGRNDQLKAVIGYDNSAFTAELEKRGFRVLPKARSNYRETGFSLPSIFAMDYPFTDDRPLPRTMKNFFTPDAGANAVMKKAWSLGYDYLHIDTNIWGVTACPEHQRVVCLTPRDAKLSSGQVEILEAINKMTPVSYFFSLNAEMNKATTIDDVTAAVRKRGFDRPQLMFAHTMQPHSPYAFKADCSPQPKIRFSLSGPGDSRKYVEAIKCVNLMMLRFADMAAAQDPDAIIILSSDHGSKFTLDEAAMNGRWTKRQFDERYGALLAIRGPKRCLDQLQDDMTLVNVYRWAFACAEGRAPVLLDNRFYDVNYDAIKEGGGVRRFPADGPPA